MSEDYVCGVFWLHSCCSNHQKSCFSTVCPPSDASVSYSRRPSPKPQNNKPLIFQTVDSTITTKGFIHLEEKLVTFLYVSLRFDVKLQSACSGSYPKVNKKGLLKGKSEKFLEPFHQIWRYSYEINCWECSRASPALSGAISQWNMAVQKVYLQLRSLSTALAAQSAGPCPKEQPDLKSQKSALWCTGCSAL